MILIGSQAIKHYFSDFHREPKDIDYAVSKKVSEEDRSLAKKMLKIEYLYNPVLIDNGTGIATPNQLCTLKASHLCWNIQWDKHMFDLQFLLKKGCTIDHELFFKLYRFWNEYNSKNKRSDLRMSKEDFFTNGVNYDTLEHDAVHKIINPIPIYTTILKDGEEVELDENKWEQLPFEDNLNLVREEVYVMAYERYKDENYHVAYARMLKKFIRSHAPIFSLIFILENYLQLYKPKINFLNQINNELQRVKQST